MERYVRFIVRHRVAVVAAILSVTGLLATQLFHLHVEIRRRANLPNDHPFVQVQNRISELFGGESIVVIGVFASTGDIFTPQLLGKIYRITDRLRTFPGVVESSLFSIAAPYVKTIATGRDGVLDVRRLMTEPGVTQAASDRIRADVYRDPLLRNTLVSSDGTAAVIVAEFDERMKDVELAHSIEQIVAPERDATAHIAIGGNPILRAELARYTAMMAFLFPIAVIVIALVHYEAFRTVQAMLLPIVTALLSVIWALGIMGFLQYPIDTWSAMTPVLILAIAAGHAVQLLKRYYEELRRACDSTEAVVRSVIGVGPVMLIAGSIAAAGFASLTTFGITSMRAFGLLIASGIASALIIEMTFTPACRCLLPAPKNRETRREHSERWLDHAVERLSMAVIAHPSTVLTAAAVVVIGAAAGMMRINVDNSFRLWFSPDTQIRRDDALLNEKLPGSATLRILVEGGQDDVLLQSGVLRAISDLESEMTRDPQVGGVSSIADHVKRIHQAMQGGDPSAYAIPDDARTIGQYLFLYSASAGPDGLSAFVDATNRRTVIRALSKTDSAAFSREYLRRLQNFADERFKGLPVRVGIAGGTLGVQTAMNDLVVHDKLVNMLQVSATIFVLCALVLRSLIGGLFVLTPLAIAVVGTFGLMGWIGVWLDMSTAAMTAMGISIGADFAIYLLFRIREEWQDGRSLEDAVIASMRTSGKAIFYVSSAMMIGYMVLPLSGFSVWERLGMLTTAGVGLSAVATLTVIPCLAIIWRPRFLSAVAGESLPSIDQPCVPQSTWDIQVPIWVSSGTMSREKNRIEL